MALMYGHTDKGYQAAVIKYYRENENGPVKKAMYVAAPAAETRDDALSLLLEIMEDRAGEEIELLLERWEGGGGEGGKGVGGWGAGGSRVGGHRAGECCCFSGSSDVFVVIDIAIFNIVSS
jgi:hypothetical protein